jgi:hypothetical protein
VAILRRLGGALFISTWSKRAARNNFDLRKLIRHRRMACPVRWRAVLGSRRPSDAPRMC